MTDGPSPATGVRASSLRALVLAALFLALLTGALALSQTAASGLPPTTFLALHAALGAALGLLLLGVLIATVLWRRELPGTLHLSAAAFGLVLLMGGVGQGLLSGTLPIIFVVLQTGFLGLLVIFLVLLWARARLFLPAAPLLRWRGRGRRPREPSDPNAKA